jgi:hypothetical protein
MTAIYWCRPIQWDKLIASESNSSTLSEHWGDMHAHSESEAVEKLEQLIASEAKRILVNNGAMTCSRVLSKPNSQRTASERVQLAARIQDLASRGVWQTECEQCPVVRCRGGIV